MSIFSQQVFERALKTFAQTLLAFFIGNVTVLNIDWEQALSISATAALASVLSSWATATFTQNSTPSLVKLPESGPKHLAVKLRANHMCTLCASQDTVQTILPQDSAGAETLLVHSPGPGSSTSV